MFGTFLIDLTVIFGKKLGLLELYRIAVHHIHLTWWPNAKRIYFKNVFTFISHTFWHWFHLQFLKVLQFDLTISTVMLYSLSKLFIWYTYWKRSKGCLQIYPKQFRWMWYQQYLFWIQTQELRLLPKRSRIVNNSTMNN